MSANPLETLAAAPMRWRQYVVIALCCLINLSEGYDLVSLAYAAPVMLKEWNSPRDVLGVVFSVTQVGIAIGAFTVGPLADRIGRRSVMFIALIAITAAHFFSSITTSIQELAAFRCIMGVGLGFLTVSLNVMVSEYANADKRSMAMSLLHSGFTVGMMLGGLCAALVLEPLGWRAVFTVGVVMNAALLVMLVFFMWESPRYLLTAQPRNALARINRMLTNLGHPALEALPPKPNSTKAAANVGAMLGPDQRLPSVLLWSAALAYAIVGYFLLNWKPVVFVDAGLTPTQAAYSSVATSFTGVLGHIVMGALCRKGGEAKWTAIFFALMSVGLVVFGNLTRWPLLLILVGACQQFCTVAAYTGIFLVAVAIYAPAQRSVGVGFVTGFSRVGSIIGPFLGGMLMSAGFVSSQTFGVFASIAVVPAVLMFMLSRRKVGAQQSAEAAV